MVSGGGGWQRTPEVAQQWLCSNLRLSWKYKTKWFVSKGSDHRAAVSHQVPVAVCTQHCIVPQTPAWILFLHPEADMKGELCGWGLALQTGCLGLYPLFHFPAAGSSSSAAKKCFIL